MARPTLGALAWYFVRLGTTGFGGPIALTGAMQRDLVDERGWVSAVDFREGLALAQLAPGPLAAQLAMYIGYLSGGSGGALLVALAFILPSLLMVWALAIAYVAYGGLSWMQALFYGINAGVIGIIMRSAWKLTHVALGRDRLLWAIAAVLALVTAVLEREVVWLFGAAGLVALVKVRGTSSLPAMAMIPGLAATTAPLAGPTTLPHIFWFFAKAGAVVFGSGLAIVPFLYGGTVQQEGWLTDQQFLDAVAVAMITPGPVVITVGFIGYLVAGSPGLLAAAAGVFLPVYLFVVIPAPYFRRLNAQAGVRAFVDGVTAAATGAIAGAAVVLARRAWIDGWTVAIGLVVLASLVRWRIPEVWVVVATGVLGLLLAPKVR